MPLGSAQLGGPWILGGGGALPSRIHYTVKLPGWALACPRKYGVCIVLVVERNILLFHISIIHAVAMVFLPTPGD